jgi:hypothetical protein
MTINFKTTELSWRATGIVLSLPSSKRGPKSRDYEVL